MFFLKHQILILSRGLFQIFFMVRSCRSLFIKLYLYKYRTKIKFKLEKSFKSPVEIRFKKMSEFHSHYRSASR